MSQSTMAANEGASLRLFEDRFNALKHRMPLTFEDALDLVFKVTPLRLLEPFVVTTQNTFEVPRAQPPLSGVVEPELGILPELVVAPVEEVAG